MELPVLRPGRWPWAALLAPVDIAFLVWVRVGFGLILLWEAIHYALEGWVEYSYMYPPFHFTYHGFSWVHPWSGMGMYAHFAVLAALALAIAVGFHYRVAATLFAFGFAYVFLLEQTQYLNHHYLVCLLAFLLPFLPAHRCFSLDARRHPGLRSDWAPAWTLWLLRTQVGIVYFYGGLAKLNDDWLFHAQPLRMWMEIHHGHWPVVGRFLAWDPTAWAMSYSGLLIDLLAVPLLLYRRTRPLMLAALFSFHVLNMFFFNIGIFPYLMMVLTLIFLPPGWPRRAFPRAFGAAGAPPRPPPRFTRRQTAGMAVLGLHVLVQLLYPLRHHLYPGNPSWTGQGQRFAWHMMLRDMQTQMKVFAIEPATGKSWRIDPLDMLTPNQTSVMAKNPDMIVQFAHHVAEKMEEKGHPGVQVRMFVNASLNGRRPQRLVDPKVDFARVERRIWPPADWIVPLEDE